MKLYPTSRPTPTTKPELIRAAELVEANRLSSDEWYSSLHNFDLIKFATPASVLAIAAEVQFAGLNHVELSTLLKLRATGGRR